MKEIIQSLSLQLGIGKTTVATILVTITVFVAGILINLAINEFKALLQRRIHRILAKINHKQLLVQVNRQSRDYEKFQEQLDIDHLGAYIFNFKMLPSLEAFYQIGYENLYKAYFKGIENFFSIGRKNKIMAFSTLWKILDYLKNTHQSSLLRGETFINESAKLNELRNNSIGKVQLNVERFRILFHRKLEIKEPLGTFYDEREIIIRNWRNNDDHTLPKHIENYLQALINQSRNNVDLIQRYENDIQSVDLNASINEASIRYQNMVNHLAASQHYFVFLSTEYLKNYKSLIKIYPTLNN